MLGFHNRVVDALVAAGFTGDIFVEARRIVTGAQEIWRKTIVGFLLNSCPPVKAQRSSNHPVCR
jgi:hypothetical protein